MVKVRLNFRKVAAIAAYLVITLLFASCKKDDNGTVFLLKEIQFSDDRRYVFEYDNQNRITKRTEYIANVRHTDNIFNYHVAEDLIEMIMENHQNSQLNGKITFYKNGNKITYDVYNGHREIELNTQGLPEKLTIDYQGGAGAGFGEWRTASAIFTWQNGNLTKEEWEEDAREYGEEGSLFSIINRTYDDKKSPFYHCKTPKWLIREVIFDHYNENNIKTETVEYIPPIFAYLAPTYEYSYNDDGFPVTNKISFGEYPDLIYTETYKYKKK